ncbi:multidrug effflux MFS transporter [Okibacterium endophyticum]
MTRASRTPRRAWDGSRVGAITAVACVLAWFGPFTIDAYSPALPAIGEALREPVALIQVTLTSALIGLVAGQVVFGVVSDRLGRRLPLLGGLSLFTAASVVCIVAPDVSVLIVARFAQGLGAASAVAGSRAIGRDLFEGGALALFYSRLASVTALGPVTGTLLAGVLLDATGEWRSVFVMIGSLGVIALVLVVFVLPETRRMHAAEPRASTDDDALERRAVFVLARQPRMLVATALMACTAGGFVTYLGGSTFLFQQDYGVSPSGYSVIFATSAVGLAVCSHVNGRLATRWHPATIAVAGTTAILVVVGSLLVAFVLYAPLPVVIGLMVMLMSAFGFVTPNATTLGMAVDRRYVGTAAAFMGVAQFCLGACAVPLLGVTLDGPVPMLGVLLLTFAVAAFTIAVLGRRMFIRRVPWSPERSAPSRQS